MAAEVRGVRGDGRPRRAEQRADPRSENTPAPRTTSTIVARRREGAARPAHRAHARRSGAARPRPRAAPHAVEAPAARIEPIEQRARRDRGRRPPRSRPPGPCARSRDRPSRARAARRRRRSSLRRSDSVMAARADARPRSAPGWRGLDERDAPEDERRLARVAGREQSPALGEQSLDPVVVGRCHYMCPRIVAATLSGKAVRAFQGESFDRGDPGRRLARSRAWLSAPSADRRRRRGRRRRSSGGHEGRHRALVPAHSSRRCLGGLQVRDGQVLGELAQRLEVLALDRRPRKRRPRRPARPRAPRRGRSGPACPRRDPLRSSRVSTSSGKFGLPTMASLLAKNRR